MNSKFTLPLAFMICTSPVLAETQVELAYTCDNGEVAQAIYVNDTEPQLVVLTLNGVAHVLRSAVAASGARYTEKPDGEVGMVWWEDGEGATLERPNSADATATVAVQCHE